MPKLFELVEALPLTAVGKVDKKVLRAKRLGRSDLDGGSSEAASLAGSAGLQTRTR